ncbi:MAG: hypothetical protein H0T79_14380 [Deltaproteobacteria bacterium]|nr:hypothetical protein [Deltaproteobacteria bacterium]
MEHEHRPKPAADAHAAPALEADLAPEADHAPADLDRLWGLQPGAAPAAESDAKLIGSPVMSADSTKAVKPVAPKVTTPGGSANFRDLQTTASDKTSAALGASIMLAAAHIDDAATKIAAVKPEPQASKRHDEVRGWLDAVADGKEVAALAEQFKEVDKKTKPAGLGRALVALSSAKRRLEAAASRVKSIVGLDEISLAGLNSAIERLYRDRGYALADLPGNTLAGKTTENVARDQALAASLEAARANVNAMRVGLIPATENKLREELYATMAHIDQATTLVGKGNHSSAATIASTKALDAEIRDLAEVMPTRESFKYEYTASSIQSKMTRLRQAVHP